MSYKRDGDRITLEMDVEDFDSLLIALGFATALARHDGRERLFWHRVALVNRINEGNPNYTPNEIPREFQETK